MNLNEVVEKFRKYPANMGCGSGKLAKRYDTTPEIVKQAREIVRKEVKEDFIYEVKSIVKEMVGITELETDHSSGAQKFQVNSDKPLSPKEIEEMVGVDNISTFVDRSWLKSHKNGTWTYSVLTICKIKDFYNAAELDKRLKELFDDSYGTELNYDPRPSDKALFVYIADDHAGLVLKDSLYGKEYSSSIYQCRLETVAQEIKNLDKHFQELYIIRLGDEMDGYNGKTTRYDHDLGSLSNKEQFDIYTTANKQFYNSVFSSGVANNYHLITLSNSNHTGKGFSHMANKALEFWLEAKYPFVNVSQQDRFIDVITFGNHIIGLTHGKDEQFMKSPLPLNLDYKTDLWLMEYYKRYVHDGAFVSTIKGDIHKFNMNQGKSGRYVNVPAISTGSAWVEHNFGDSEAGVVMEIYTANNKNVITIPVWF